MLFDFESHTSITTIHKKHWFSSRWRRKQTKHANFRVGVQYPLKHNIVLNDLSYGIVRLFDSFVPSRSMIEGTTYIHILLNGTINTIYIRKKRYSLLYVTRYSKRYLTTLPTSYWFGINTFSHKRSAVFSSQAVHDIIGCKLWPQM